MLLPVKRDEKVKFLTDLYHRVRDEMADWRDKASVYYRLYNSYVDEDEYPLRFKMFFPVCFSIIETIKPRFMQGLMYRDPLMQVSKSHPNTPDEAVIAAARLLNNKWMIDPDTWADIFMMITEALIIGTSAAKICFKKQQRVMKKYEKIEANGFTYPARPVIQSVNVVNRPVLHHVDMYDVYPDLGAKHDDDMRFVFHAIVKGMDEIEHGYVDYKNIAALRDAGDWDVDDTFTNSRLREDDKDNCFDLRVVPDKPRLLVECTWREWTEAGEVIRVVTIGNEKVLLRDETINIWPWVFMRNNPVPHEFLGRSELQPLEKLQFGLNDLLNMTLDNMLMALTKMWVVGDEAEADLDQFVLEPMNVIQVANIDQVRSESWGDINPSSSRLEQTIVEAIQQASGVSDFLRGATPSRKEFATTVLALQQAAEARIDSKIKFFERTAISPIARKFIEYAQEYLEDPEYVSDGKGGFYEIDMYSLGGLMDFQLNAAAMGSQELQRTKLNDFISAAGNLLGPESPPSLRVAILKRIALTLDLDNPEEFLNELDKAAQGTGVPNPGGMPSAGGSLSADANGGLGNLAAALASAQGSAMQTPVGNGGPQPNYALLQGG